MQRARCRAAVRQASLRVGILFAFCTLLAAAPAQAATYRTQNFIVYASTAEIAKAVATSAEHHRRELAIAWLGRDLPCWSTSCPITVEVGQMAPGGETTFSFGYGEVTGWQMRVRGPLQQIVDSVIPHEVSHAVLASHFRRPIPRWADEGAAVLSEDTAERQRQQLRVEQLLRQHRPIPLWELLTIQDYPANPQSTAALYAQGYSLCDFLVQSAGKSVYVAFLKDAQQRGWDPAVRHYYGYQNVAALEQSWNTWVKSGCQPFTKDSTAPVLAKTGTVAATPASSTSTTNSTAIAAAAVSQVREEAQPATTPTAVGTLTTGTASGGGR